MDAVKFIEERNRMCGTMSEVWGVDAAQIVKNTEEWAAAHPRKTRKSVFLERYSNAQVVADTDITKKMKVSGLPSKEQAAEAWNRRADNG